MLDFIALWLLFLITLPWFIGKFIYFMIRRNWCISTHWSTYVRSGANEAYCPRCKWKITPYNWEE